MCTILGLIGFFVVLKFLFGILFPVTTARLKVAHYLRTLDHVLEAEMRRLEQKPQPSSKDEATR